MLKRRIKFMRNNFITDIVKMLMLPVLFCFILSSCRTSSDIVSEESSADITADFDVSESVVLYPYTFEDSSGNSVTLREKPKRPAVLFSSFADVWRLSGGECYITVGESEERGYAEENTLFVDSGAGKTIDNELLISYEPDFVIVSADIPAQAETAELLRSYGIPCAEMRVESFSDYLYMLKICTDINEVPEAFTEYGTNLSYRIDDIFSKLPESNEQKRILFIRSGSSASSAKAKTADKHFAACMLEELGAYNIADNAEILLDGLSIEEILNEDPDMIFVVTMGDEEAAKVYMDSVFESPAWQSLSAVKNQKYYYLPKDLFQYKPNEKWYDAYLYLAELLYPDVYKSY